MADDKYANSKCFILSQDGYEEITYSELCRRWDADTTYEASHFSPWKVRGIFYLPPLFLENRIIRLQILSACCSRKEQAACFF